MTTADGFVRNDFEILTVYVVKNFDIQNVRKGPDQVKDENTHFKKLL